MLKFTVKTPSTNEIEKVVQEGIKRLMNDKLANLKCKEHGTGVEVIIDGTSYSFTSCCDAFRSQVTDALKP